MIRKLQEFVVARTNLSRRAANRSMHIRLTSIKLRKEAQEKDQFYCLSAFVQYANI